MHGWQPGVQGLAHAGVFAAVARTMHDYLGLTVPVLGWLRSSAAIHESVNSRQPLALDPDTKDTAAFRVLAQAVLATLTPRDKVATDEPSAAWVELVGKLACRRLGRLAASLARELQVAMAFDDVVAQRHRSAIFITARPNMGAVDFMDLAPGMRRSERSAGY